MSKNLPKRQLKKIIENFPFQKVNSFWYLFHKGRHYLEGDTLYFNLWVVNISKSHYPITEFHKTQIKLKALSNNSHFYVLGSIYDYHGNIVSIPGEAPFLDSIKLVISKEEKPLNHSYYDSLKESSYPIPNLSGELKGFPFYLKKIRDTSVIIPVSLIIDFFFLSHSTKLNNLILRNTLDDHLKYIGRKDKEGYLSLDRSALRKLEALYIGKFLFTESNSGSKALKELSTAHIIKLYQREKSAYLNSLIPFFQDCKFKLVGHRTNHGLFLAQRIVSFDLLDKDPFLVNEIILSIINDNISTGNYHDDNSISYNLPSHDYGQVGNNTDYFNSDSNSEIYDTEEFQSNSYSFNHLISSKTINIDSNKHKYILDMISPGNQYIGGSTNIYGEENENNITKTNIVLSIFDLFTWNQYAVKALIKLCNKHSYQGNFLNLNSSYSEKNYKHYKERDHILSWTPIGAKQSFKFVLFEILNDDRFYYFFERGPGSYSAVFSSSSYRRLSSREINNFLKKIIESKQIRWSQFYQNDEFLGYGIRVYQPIKHPKKQISSLSNGQEELVNELVKRIEKRIIF